MRKVCGGTDVQGHGVQATVDHRPQSLTELTPVPVGTEGRRFPFHKGYSEIIAYLDALLLPQPQPNGTKVQNTCAELLRLITHDNPDPDALSSQGIIHAAIEMVYGHNTPVIYLGRPTNPNLRGLYKTFDRPQEIDVGDPASLQDLHLFGTDIHDSNEPHVRRNHSGLFPRLKKFLDHHFNRNPPAGGVTDTSAGSATAVALGFVEELFAHARRLDPPGATELTLENLFLRNPGLAKAAFAAIMTDETNCNPEELIAGNYSSVGARSKAVLEFLSPSASKGPALVANRSELKCFDTREEPFFNECFRRAIAYSGNDIRVPVGGDSITLRVAIIGDATVAEERYLSTCAAEWLKMSTGIRNPVIMVGVFEHDRESSIRPMEGATVPTDKGGVLRFYVRTHKNTETPDLADSGHIVACLSGLIPNAYGGGREHAGRLCLPDSQHLEGRTWQEATCIVSSKLKELLTKNLTHKQATPESIIPSSLAEAR